MSFAKTPHHVATLSRREMVPLIVGNHTDFLFVTSLAGANYDVAAISNYGGNAFINGGAMGCATMLGLGLALAQPTRRVMVVTGDGDLLMSLGSLATIAVSGARNLTVLVVDNGHYGETGYQTSHTSLGIDLTGVAKSCGIENAVTVSDETEAEAASRLIRQDGPNIVVAKVTATDPPKVRLNLHPTAARERFKSNLSGNESGIPVGNWR